MEKKTKKELEKELEKALEKNRRATDVCRDKESQCDTLKHRLTSTEEELDSLKNKLEIARGENDINSSKLTALKDLLGDTTPKAFILCATSILTGTSLLNCMGLNHSKNVILENHGELKINAIKALREAHHRLFAGELLGLKKAKDLIETPRAILFRNITEEQVAIVEKTFDEFGSDAVLEITQ